MKTSKQIEQAKIIEQAILEIRDRKANIAEVFQDYNLNYKPKTYYALKKRYEENGFSGLISRKQNCGRKKKTASEEYQFIITQKSQTPGLTAAKIKQKLGESQLTELSIPNINKILRNHNIENKQGRPKKIAAEIVAENEISYAGMIFLLSAIQETDFSDYLLKTQQQIIASVESSQSEQINGSGGGIYQEQGVFCKDSTGKFISYAPEKKVDGELSVKFNSVTERVKTRDLSRLSISQATDKTLNRKNLAVFCLPIITSNSRFTELDETVANELQFFCGYDYKGNTIEKYMRELKYLQSSHLLMEEMANYWYQLWQDQTSDQIKQVCYYFDGNRKPLWSRYRVKQSKVTMVGRVMGCLEQVYIHTEQGHPLLFQTYPGGAHLPTAIKTLHRQMDRIIPHDVSRISIFDAAANSVDFYESFKDNEYFICLLDSNQYHQDLSDFTIGPQQQSEHGLYLEASKTLTNSKNKQLYHARTPIYKRIDGDKYVAFVTNIPEQEKNAQSIIECYYRRWPNQENQFRDMNNGVNLRTNYGFGKIKVINLVVLNKKKYLQQQLDLKKAKLEKLAAQQQLIKQDRSRRIQDLTTKKQDCQQEINEQQQKIELGLDRNKLKASLRRIGNLYQQQERLQTRIIKHEFQVTAKLEKLTNQIKRNHSLITKHQTELNRISNKEIVYENDIELDQLLGAYKIAFANLSAYVLKEYFSDTALSLEKLINKIYKRPGRMRMTDNKKEISIYLSKKDVKMSQMIIEACEVINNKEIKIDDKLVKLIPVYEKT